MMSTALIVEDETEANRLLSQLVRLRGYDTESAFTGGQALEMARRRHPDLVFLDLMLPDTDGYQVCRALKDARETATIPIVVVTARIEQENRLQSYRLGANEYVSKPYTPDQIFEAMAAADSWRRDLAEHATSGEIAIDAKADVEPFEQITRLKALLLSQTAWAEAEVLALGQDLVTMTQNLLEWGRKHRFDRVASLGYELHDDRFVLEVHDPIGWSAGENLPYDHGLGLLQRPGRFDAVEYATPGTSQTFTKRLKPLGQA